MKRVGVLINPASGRGNGLGLALGESVLAAKTADVCVMQSFQDAETCIKQFCRSGVDLIFISSGDGTIQHVQTLLAERLRPSPMPRLCLLPHGTTNMTAADIGFRQRKIAAQSAFIANPVPCELRRRSTLRISNAGDGLIRHGMFLGAGAISAAARYCQTVLNDRGIHGNWATGATLAIALLRARFGLNARDRIRFDRPYELSLSIDGRSVVEGPKLFALCTTLEKLILGSRPFWSGEPGRIRWTSMGYPFHNMIRWTYPVLFGKEGRRFPENAVSGSATRVSLKGPDAYVLDGEFFEGSQDRELDIELGPDFEYVIS